VSKSKERVLKSKERVSSLVISKKINHVTYMDELGTHMNESCRIYK